MRALVVLSIPVALLLTTCAKPNKQKNPSLAPGRVLNRHGIELGDTIAPTELACSPGGRRGLPGVDEFEVVTFSTPGDCSECQHHLKGLEQAGAVDSLVGRGYYVVLPSGSDLQASLRVYRAWSDRRVCFDSTGAVWEQLRIAHTPVTVLLHRGEVVYMVDAPLESDRARSLLLGDLATAVQLALKNHR